MARRHPLITSADALTDLFSCSRYIPCLGTPQSIPLIGTRKELRFRLRSECPHQPGVYGLADGRGQLIYVGMSRKLRSRLYSYFSSRSGRQKERRIGRQARTLIWQPVAHELIARLRERELIRQYRPGWNVQGHPTRMKLGYIVLLDQDACSFSLQPRIPRRCVGVWGPVPVTKYVRRAVEELNHHFQLRDCPRETPMRFRGESHLFEGNEATPCLRADLKTCLSPCISGCTRKTYSNAVTAARRFLDGKSTKAISDLETAMQTAVAQRQFEKAAKHRDRRQALLRIDHHLRRFHDWTSRANFVYRVTSSLDQQEWWLVSLRGVLCEIIPRPRGAQAKSEFVVRIEQVMGQLGGESEKSSLTGPDEFESARLLFRWFRQFPAEKERRITLAKSRRLCQSNARSTEERDHQ